MLRRASFVLSILCVLVVLAFPPTASAQLPEPNAIGVATGHIHLNVSNVEAQKKLWVDLGAEVTATGTLELLRIPGMYLILRDRKPTGPSVGTTVNHFGFFVRSYATIRSTLIDHNMEITSDLPDNKQITVQSPDGARLEFTESDSINVPIEFHHIHMAGTDQEGIRDWYVKIFGAEASSRRAWPSAVVPGGRIDVIKAETGPEPTLGRAIDHIGFEVADMDAFAARLRSEGVEFNVEPREIPRIGLKIAFITDPIGTYIEITEGLAGK
jgi:catechol 2,3-dioxygenase-like lactoylglutathione lyase family enzyme